MIKGSEQSPFPFYRDFSDTFTVVFDFVRVHSKVLFKIMLITVIPLSVLEGILSFYVQDVAHVLLGESGNSDNNLILFSASLLLSYLIYILNATLTTQYCYSIHHDGKIPDSIMSQIKNSMVLIPKFTLLTVLSSIVSVIAALFCLLPFIYVFVPLHMVYAIALFEKTNVVQTIDKSVSLVRRYWWSTFGIIILLTIVGVILSSIFFIPEIISELMKLFDNEAAYEVTIDTTESSDELLYLPFYVVSTIIDNLFATVILIASVFRYFSLTIAQNGLALQTDINSLGTETKHTDEETY